MVSCAVYNFHPFLRSKKKKKLKLRGQQSTQSDCWIKKTFPIKCILLYGQKHLPENTFFRLFSDYILTPKYSLRLWLYFSDTDKKEMWKWNAMQCGYYLKKEKAIPCNLRHNFFWFSVVFKVLGCKWELININICWTASFSLSQTPLCLSWRMWFLKNQSCHAFYRLQTHPQMQLISVIAFQCNTDAMHWWRLNKGIQKLTFTFYFQKSNTLLMLWYVLYKMSAIYFASWLRNVKQKLHQYYFTILT